MRQISRLSFFLFVSAFAFTVIAPVAHPQALSSVQDPTTIQQPGPWDLGTRSPNWQATSVLNIQNHCQGKHLFDVLTENLSFVHFLAETKNVNVAGQAIQTLPLQFNAAGMRPGDYNGQVIVKCLDCVQEPTCKQDREILPVHLTIVPAPPQPPKPPSPASWSATPGEIVQSQEPPALKSAGPQQYFLPVAMERLEPSTLKWLMSPFPPSGQWWACCCCCLAAPQQPAPAPAPSSGPAPKPPALSVALSWNPPMVVTYVPVTPINAAGYSGEIHVQWSASSSGSSGQITVDLEVQRSGSTRWETLVTGRGPSDQYTFTANAPGTYLFRATAKDSTGASGWNTMSVTFPRI